MVNLRRSEISIIESFVGWPRGLGYVLDYSDRTFAEFFEDYLRIDIEQERFHARGNSKRHRLISFCLQEPDLIVLKALRLLYDERKSLEDKFAEKANDGLEKKFLIY